MSRITLHTLLVVFACFTSIGAKAAAAPFSPAPRPVESLDVGTVHVDKFGSGAQPLILIPGLGGGAWVWYGTIEQFAPTHTLYVITLPGFDGRPTVEEKPLFPTFARDFWALLTTQKIDRPIVIGHSLGGTLAIALAEEHPDRLAGIIAVDGLPVFPMLANATAQQREAMATQLADAYAAFSRDQALAAQKDFMRLIGTMKPELVEPAAVFQARSDPKAHAAWLREDLTTDLRPNLAKVTIPLVEIMPHDPAEATGAIPQTRAQKLSFYKSLLAGTRNARVIPVSPSRHFVMFDQPEALHQAIEAFADALRK